MKPTHEELQRQVIELAHTFRWHHLHIRRSLGRGRKWVTTTNVTGWPDLLLWNVQQPTRHVAIEVKVPPDKLTADQERVLDQLFRSGFETYVVTPADLESLVTVFRPRIHDTPAGNPLP